MDFNFTNSTYINRKYKEFYEKHGYIPKMLEPYNGVEVTDIAPTLTTNSNQSSTKSGTILILEIVEE